MDLTVLKIAPIWKSKEELEKVMKKKDAFFREMLDSYIYPYFLNGILRLAEKGENLIIRDQMFFINDCSPKSGFVRETTFIEIEIGFTEDTFK
jgi:hypothetical protein